MREDVDLEAAVAAGLIGEDQALALRNLDAQRSGISAASAERIEFASGVADVMTAVGLFALTYASLFLVMAFPPSALLVIPALFWGGRRFTVERRMAASAFVVFFFYCVVLSGTAIGIGMALAHAAIGATHSSPLQEPLALLLVGVLVTGGCALWWRITHLPIAVAAAWVAALNLVTQGLRLLVPGAPSGLVIWFHLAWGLVIFAVALWWDMTDIRRETIRSRVAFWCHGAAGFFLAHSVLILVAGRSDSAQGWQALYFAHPAQLQPGGVLPFLLFFLLCAVVALLIDRRSFIFATIYQATLAMALVVNILPALAMMGAVLVVLALNWQRMRTVFLKALPPALAAQLPRVELTHESRRPTRRHDEMLPRRIDALRRAARAQR